jgi:Flp pilus assembly protein CpaB
MSPVAPRRPGHGPFGGVPLSAIAAGVAVIGVVSWLAVVGLPFSLFGPSAPTTAGLVAVPTPAVVIPAYARVKRDHLWDRRAARIAVVYLPPRAVTAEMLTNLSDIIGRVLDHQKEPGYVFTAADFLPPGTREGLVAGIPAGRRAIRVSADRVDGLFGLHTGDRFDVLATMPIEANRGGQPFAFAGPYGQELALQAQLSNWGRQATVRVIVQNATVVEPMAPRSVTATQSSLTDGAVTRARTIQEAVIAVDPDEVVRLTEAMAVEARLTTIPRSGRPDDPIGSRTPDLKPVSPFASPAREPSATDGGADAFRTVEMIMGQQRSLTAVPRR